MLTSEQQVIVDHLQSPSGVGYTLVDSVAGLKLSISLYLIQ